MNSEEFLFYKKLNQNMNSNSRKIEKNSAVFREFAKNSHACTTAVQQDQRNVAV